MPFLRYLNGFNLIGGILLLIALVGLLRGNAALAEPGGPINPYGWLLYLGASAIMLVNGMLSYRLHRERLAEQEANKPKGSAPTETSTETVNIKSGESE